MILLENESVRALIDPKGAEPVFFGHRNGENVFWEKETGHWNRVAPHLFPVVGRLVNDSYSWHGKHYQLTQHGFARDRVFEVELHENDKVIFSLIHDAQSAQVYPFDFELRVIYMLTGKELSISYHISNKGEEVMPYSVGGHPAFRLFGPLDEHVLIFDPINAEERWLLNGSYLSGETEPLNIDGGLQLCDRLFERDAIVFRNPAFRSVELRHKNRGTQVTVSTSSWEAFGIWTKAGAPFLCLEPWWGFADPVEPYGELDHKPGIHLLEPGATETLAFSITAP